MSSLTQRKEAEIEWLTEGRNFKYEGVVFSLSKRQSKEILAVSSYTSYIRPENTSEKEGKEKIERSKQVGDYLSKESKMFGRLWSEKEKEFFFCYDYHTGAVALASEIDGRFEWFKPNKTEQGSGGNG